MISNCTRFERNVMRDRPWNKRATHASCTVRFGLLCEQNGLLCKQNGLFCERYSSLCERYGSLCERYGSYKRCSSTFQGPYVFWRYSFYDQLKVTFFIRYKRVHLANKTARYNQNSILLYSNKQIIRFKISTIKSKMNKQFKWKTEMKERMINIG